MDNLEVRCSPGSSNGGSSQRFVAKVFAASTHTLLAELKRKIPRFHVTGLTAGQDYLITVTAVNDKGASEPQEIDAFRLKVQYLYLFIDLDQLSNRDLLFLGLNGRFPTKRRQMTKCVWFAH